MKALQVAYPSHEAARAGVLEERITDFYPGSSNTGGPPRPGGRREGRGHLLGDIYCWNVWPSMKKCTWGTYPSFLGHKCAGAGLPLPRQGPHQRGGQGQLNSACATRSPWTIQSSQLSP